MSIYQLITNAKAQQTIANVPAIDDSNASATPGINGIAQPLTTSSNNPTQSQGFQVIVSGAGSVSATAHIVGSNDGIHWAETGITVTAGPSSSVATGVAASQNTPYAFFGAYMSALSAGATANVSMSA